MPVTLRGQKVKYSTEKILSLFGRITFFGAKCFTLAVNKTLILRVRGSKKKIFVMYDYYKKFIHSCGLILTRNRNQKDFSNLGPRKWLQSPPKFMRSSQTREILKQCLT